MFLIPHKHLVLIANNHVPVYVLVSQSLGQKYHKNRYIVYLSCSLFSKTSLCLFVKMLYASTLRGTCKVSKPWDEGYDVMKWKRSDIRSAGGKKETRYMMTEYAFKEL